MAAIGKKNLAKQVANSTGLSVTASESLVNAVLASITQGLAEGQEVTLVGLGRFSTLERAARDGRNPATGEPIRIEAATVPKFKPGRALKEAVNNGFTLPLPI